MDGVRIISVSDLLHLYRPLTGAASLHTPTSSPPPLKKHKPHPLDDDPTKTQTQTQTQTQTHIHLSDPNPNPRLFAPINHPVLLIGTIDISTEDPNQCSGCKDHCFSFSDGSSRVCCAVLDLDLKIIGRKIHVLAWNFVPFKHKKGGVLEVIRWSLPASELKPHQDSFLSVPSCSSSSSQEDNSPAGCRAFGTLKLISPVFSVPCRNLTDGGDSIGFLAQIASCGCDFCSNSLSVSDVNSPDWKENCHSFTNSTFVYFLKPTSIWRPVLAKLIGKFILITGLKKKLIYVGGDASYLMFVPTLKTVVSLCCFPVKTMLVGSVVGKRKDDGGIYSGVVTGVYMQGMVVELDEKVWLLITDPMISPQHSLRVGAIISIRNYNLVYAKFSWIRMLLLGTCVRTCIDVKSFSLSDTRCHVRTQSQSMIGKFIESLTLSARFWVLLLVSSFRRKFAKIFSDKEILGSNNHEGLAQVYASAYLPSHFFDSQHGVFMEFCKHDQCTYRNKSNLTPFKLVIPISNLLSKCEEIFVSTISKIQNDAETIEKNDSVNHLSCERTSCCHIIRRIVSSEDLGFILMGCLKISSSGRLQLIDATGSIDVVIPDMLSINGHSIYEGLNLSQCSFPSAFLQGYE